MSTRSSPWLLVCGLLAAIPAPAATFSYHGTLQDGGKPADGRYDLELTLYPTAIGGTAVAGPLTLFDVPVHGGNLDTAADFGATPSLPSNAWLDVKIRPAGRSDAFASLSARSPVTAAATTSVCPGAWTLVGNTGNPAGSYLGTGDANPLVFDIAGAEVGRFSTDGNFSLRATPIDASTELNVGGAAGAGGYANVFLHQSGANDGMQVSVGEATSGANNANLYIDSYNGSARSRRLEVRGDGRVSINGDPINASTELTIAGTTASGGSADIFLHQNGLNTGIMFSSSEATAGNNDATFALDQYDGTHTARRLYVARSGNIGINALASVGGAGFLSSLTVGGGGYGTPAVDLIETDYSSGISLYESAGTNINGLIVSRITPGAVGAFPTYVEIAEFFPKLTLLNGATTNTNTDALVVGSDNTTGNGAHLTVGGVWTNGSSRTFKNAFAAIDPATILDKLLALPIQTWQYRNDAAEGRHLGPVAEDFMAAFGLGNNERYIATVDEEGVALAAIQGLNARLQAATQNLRTEKDAQIAALQSRLDALNARLAALESARER